jgi:16S rRNA (cytosine1402-N4)-methyltransferase
MRMDTTRGESVAEWLATAERQQIAEVIRDYGEERFAVQIAKAIVARRQERGPVSTTAELAELVAGAVKTREPGQNPATRTFQAFRIFINAELEELQQALEASLAVLQPRGPPRGDQLPLPGRPDREAVHRPAFEGGLRPPRALSPRRRR